MQLNQNIINNVVRDLGFEVKPDAINGTEVRLEQHLMPFFKRTPDDESTWKKNEITPHVQLEDLHRITQREGVPRFPNLKTLKAVVNPHTGLAMKVTSDWPAGVPPIAPFPGAAEEERQVRLKSERFVALPATAPDVDFYHALKQLELTGPISPKQAKQVIAYLVVHHTRKYAPRPVWIIQTRGIHIQPEGFAAQTPLHPDAVNHMRHIVDATTGAWLYSDSTPQPII